MRLISLPMIMNRVCHQLNMFMCEKHVQQLGAVSSEAYGDHCFLQHTQPGFVQGEGIESGIPPQGWGYMPRGVCVCQKRCSQSLTWRNRIIQQRLRCVHQTPPSPHPQWPRQAWSEHTALGLQELRGTRAYCLEIWAARSVVRRCYCSSTHRHV